MSPVIWLAVTQDNMHVMSYDFEDPDNTATDIIYKSLNLEQLIALAASRAGVFKSRNTHAYCERKYMDIVKKYFVECEVIPVEKKVSAMCAICRNYYVVLKTSHYMSDSST